MVKTRRALHLCGFVAGCVVFTIPAHSQISKSPADTGRMMWGREDFTRYTSARPCDRAVRETEFDMSRAYLRDTAFRVVLPSNTEPKAIPEVVAIANACGAKFTLETIDTTELWSLIRIMLARQKIAEATAAFERRLSFADSKAESTTVIVLGIEQVFRDKPVRIPYLLDLLKRLDALGAPAEFPGLQVRMLLLDYWFERYNADSLRAYAWDVIRRSKALPQKQQDALDLGEAWGVLIVLANETGDIQAQRQLLDSALETMANWRAPNGSLWLSALTQLIDTREATYGKKAHPLEPDLWTNNQNVDRPIMGKLSLIVKAHHNCGQRCYGIYDITRQLIAQHGDNIDVTYAVSTAGYAPGTGPLAIAEEAEEIKKYFVDYLNIPAAIAVFETPMSKIEDGRIVRSSSSLEDAFPMIDAILIDPAGSLRWIGPLRSRKDKRMIDAAIEHILRASK